MPVLYEAFQSVLKDKNGKKLFYPRVLRAGNVSTAQIAKEIAAYSSLSPGDVLNTLNNLATVVSHHLQASESVTLDGFGTFRMVMKSSRKGVETAEEVSAAQSSLTVRFRPCATRHPDGKVATRSLVTGARCIRFERTEAAANGEAGKPGSSGGGVIPEAAEIAASPAAEVRVAWKLRILRCKPCGKALHKSGLQMLIVNH